MQRFGDLWLRFSGSVFVLRMESFILKDTDGVRHYDIPTELIGIIETLQPICKIFLVAVAV